MRVAARYGGDEWELYNLRTDPSETCNLAVERSAILAELVSEWTRVGKEAGARVEFN